MLIATIIPTEYIRKRVLLEKRKYKPRISILTVLKSYFLQRSRRFLSLFD